MLQKSQIPVYVWMHSSWVAFDISLTLHSWSIRPTVDISQEEWDHPILMGWQSANKGVSHMSAMWEHFQNAKKILEHFNILLAQD